MSIWRTAKGEVRWKVTETVGLDSEELDQALAQAIAADRKFEREYAAPTRSFTGDEPKAA